MPRAKKDGQHINCYIDRTLCERLKAYADEKGQTMTMALERILKQYFESENKEAKAPHLILSYFANGDQR